MIAPAVPEEPVGIRGGGRRESDQVGRVEIGAVQQVEKFRAELQSQPFADSRVFQHGEIPGCQARTDESVAAEIAKEAAGGWRRDERVGIEPLAGISE